MDKTLNVSLDSGFWWLLTVLLLLLVAWRSEPLSGLIRGLAGFWGSGSN